MSLPMQSPPWCRQKVAESEVPASRETGRSSVRAEPEGIQRSECVVDDRRQPRSVGQNRRIGRIVQKQPSSYENPIDGRGAAAVQQPLDRTLWQEVNCWRVIGVLNEARVRAHPARKLTI